MLGVNYSGAHPKWPFPAFSLWGMLPGVVFSTLLGEMIQFDYHFSTGLKPPTTGWFLQEAEKLSMVVLMWCFWFFTQKTRKNHYQNNLKYVSGQITSAPNKPRVEIFAEMLVVKCSKGIPPQNALKNSFFFELESFAQLISYDLQDFNYPSTVPLHWKWPFRLRIFTG